MRSSQFAIRNADVAQSFQKQSTSCRLPRIYKNALYEECTVKRVKSETAKVLNKEHVAVKDYRSI